MEISSTIIDLALSDLAAVGCHHRWTCPVLRADEKDGQTDRQTDRYDM
jgi:hypothetical protein